MATLSKTSFDLAIIGGGINGAGLAALASQAGLSVVLFERNDFASGTSSRSTKLVHGGIRYLEQAHFSLVFEALHERKRLLAMAPHLVHPVPFLLPVYKGDRRPAWMLKLGLWLYDLLAGAHNLSRHEWFSPSQARQLAPRMKAEGLAGCGLYYDAQVNDSRLVLENILSAEGSGAVCRNDCYVTQVDREPSRIRVFFHDRRTAEEGVVQASVLVNASGPWANETARLISPDALKLVRPTRGTHLVVPQVLHDHAVLITTQEDNRVIFVIPWRGFSLVGTTDIDDTEDPERVEPTEEEIGYLLREAARVFPGSDWDRSRVIAAFAGLRPLAWSDGDDHASTVSREDRMVLEGNVLDIVGGKLTTYRSMAEKALKQVYRILGKGMPPRLEAPLPGCPAVPWARFLETEVPRWVSAYSITEAQARHLAGLYGRRATEVLRLLEEDKDLRRPLHPERPELLAQVAYAVRQEKALHLEDVMLRRLEIGYSPQRWGQAPETASQWMARSLGWDEEARKKELDRYFQRLYPRPPADR